jgi:hypothetical protein
MDGTLRATRAHFLLVGLVAAAGFIVIVGGLTLLPKTHWFDTNDIGAYYRMSSWVTSGGTLYKDLKSEYPPVANLLFAGCRLVADAVWPGFRGFAFVWINTAWLVYLAISYLLATRVGPLRWPAS